MLGFQPRHSNDLQKECRSRETQTTQGGEQREGWKRICCFPRVHIVPWFNPLSSCNMTTLFCLFLCGRHPMRFPLTTPSDMLCWSRTGSACYFPLHFLFSGQISWIPARNSRRIFRKIEEIVTHKKKLFNKYEWCRHSYYYFSFLNKKQLPGYSPKFLYQVLLQISY